MQDFLGNTLNEGDKVVCVFGRHLRKSIVEKLTEKTGITTIEGFSVGVVKIKGLKTEIYSNSMIKTNW